VVSTGKLNSFVVAWRWFHSNERLEYPLVRSGILGKNTTNFTVGWNEVTAINNPQFGVFSLALVFATNLVFGAALKLALRQYLVGQVEWSR
jgi:hypothetical protein